MTPSIQWVSPSCATSASTPTAKITAMILSGVKCRSSGWGGPEHAGEDQDRGDKQPDWMPLPTAMWTVRSILFFTAINPRARVSTRSSVARPISPASDTIASPETLRNPELSRVQQLEHDRDRQRE